MKFEIFLRINIKYYTVKLLKLSHEITKYHLIKIYHLKNSIIIILAINQNKKIVLIYF